MGTKEHLEESLHAELASGEFIVAWRPVLSNSRVSGPGYVTSLALLGPAVYRASIHGVVSSGGEFPDHVNLTIVTNERILWCSKGRFSAQAVVRGSDWLNTIAAIKVRPAKVALAKLRFVFRNQSILEFDLPSDHKSDDFVADIDGLLTRIPGAI